MKTITVNYNGIPRSVNLSSTIQHLQFAANGSGWTPGQSGSDPNDGDSSIDDPTASGLPGADDYIAQTLACLKQVNDLHSKIGAILIKAKANPSGTTAKTDQRFAMKTATPIDKGILGNDIIRITGNEPLLLNQGSMAAIRSQFNANLRK